jgi:septum formation protein
LLRSIGLRFKAEPSDSKETVSLELEPHQLTRAISLQKAQVVARRHKNALVIGADTLGVLGGRILGKPHTQKEAADMLTALSGKSHSVITGFTIIDTDTGKTVSRSVETKVSIRTLALSEIEAYVRSGEPRDKAGAYAIQGLGAVLVERIEGDYSNVVGLPLSALAQALKEFGISVL